MGEKKISPRVAAGLDLARALAAAYVVAHHLANFWQIKRPVLILFSFGQEAVIVFFLLSGFLIFANEHQRRDGLASYAGRRIRRIYPTLLCAMLVSTLIAAWLGTLAARFSLSELAGNILALQDHAAFKPGVMVDAYLGNSPLWSLSYEIVFYALFPLALALWRRSRAAATHLIGAMCCLAYASYAIAPNHVSLLLAYFQIWWLGAMMGYAYLRGHGRGRGLGSLMPVMGWTAALAATAGIVVVIVGARGLGYYPVIQLRHVIGALAMAVLAFAGVGRILVRAAVPVARPAKWAASISYGVYVLHYPILLQTGLAFSLRGFLIGTVALIALAWLTDNRMNWLMQRWARGTVRDGELSTARFNRT